MMPRILALLLSFFYLFSSPTTAQTTAEDLKLLQGTWSAASAELGGMPIPASSLQGLKLVIRGNTYTVHVGSIEDEGTITLDTASKLRRMTIKGSKGPTKDQSILALYELTGDQLRICYAMESKAFPTELKSSEKTDLFLVVYKRAKE